MQGFAFLFDSIFKSEAEKIREYVLTIELYTYKISVR